MKNTFDSRAEVTILVNSCDKYEDAWEPFFRLFHINWKDCPYRIILNTETKNYQCEFMDVRTINFHSKGSWSKRLKNVLEQIDSDYILYFLEDFFLESPVSADSFSRALELMKENKDIGYIGLKYNQGYTFKEEGKTKSEAPFLNKDDLITYNRINSMTALWRREWLISLLRMHETPWEFEKYGSIRSRRSDKKVLIINNHVCAPVFHYEIDVKYGMGIYGGKWLENNKQLFDKHGITVNFENLGIYKECNSTEKKEDVKQEQSLREQLYKIKHFFKVSKRKVNKKIREIRSLI